MHYAKDVLPCKVVSWVCCSARSYRNQTNKFGSRTSTAHVCASVRLRVCASMRARMLRHGQSGRLFFAETIV